MDPPAAPFLRTGAVARAASRPAMSVPHRSGASGRGRPRRGGHAPAAAVAVAAAALLALAALAATVLRVAPPRQDGAGPTPPRDRGAQVDAAAKEAARLRRRMEQLQGQLAEAQRRREEEPPDAAIEAARVTGVLRSRLQELEHRNRELERRLNETARMAAPEPPVSPQTPTAGTDACVAAYAAATRDRTPGLSEESLARAQAHIGNRQRLDNVARTLTERQHPLTVVVYGGSISMGHGVVRNISIGSESYLGHLEDWLNRVYPMGPNATVRHRVINLSLHGADICSLAKRNIVYARALREVHGVSEPDLVLLEYAVNDYQGQDHVEQVVSQLDVFYPGFRDIALCGEVAVHRLLHTLPRTALMFLEFRTAVPPRKTAQMLHMGIAQHYQVPVVSYADAMFPEYFEMLSRLNASDRYTVPINDTILNFPYGCQPCRREHITKQFHDWFPEVGIKDCLSMCLIMMQDAAVCTPDPPPGRADCHPSLFSVDSVHPNALGHRIAADLLVDAIADAVRRHCQKRPVSPHVVPPLGWLAPPAALRARGSFLQVRDAHCYAKHCSELQPSRRTPGFALYEDVGGKLGWIATNATGGEMIEFDIDLPRKPCYAVYLAILRSYEGMGRMIVTVTDRETNQETTKALDGLWEARISVWSDNQMTADGTAACTGNCSMIVQTLPQVDGRSGNKVKLLTLSVRECILYT